MSPAKKANFPALVVQVLEPDRVVFNRGSNDGIQKGQRFLIYALDRELFDPETNESLGQLEIVRGTGVAVHVQPRITTVESDTRAPDVRRTVRRNDPYSILSGRGEEIIEQTGATLPFDGPKVGDHVRPI